MASRGQGCEGGRNGGRVTATPWAHAEHGWGHQNQNTTKISEIHRKLRNPPNCSQPPFISALAMAPQALRLGDDGTVTSQPHASSDLHGLPLLRYPGTKAEMLCRLLGSYFNSKRNYLKWQLCVWRDADTGVSKVPSEGEAPGRCSSLSAPMSVGFCPF